MSFLTETEFVVRHFNAQAARFGRDTRACDYRCRWSFKQRQNAVLKLLGRTEQKRILDVGSGPGLFSAPLGDKNFLLGADLSLQMLRLCEAGFNSVQGRGEELPFKEDSFDVVLAIEVLQSLSDPRAFLKELSRVTRKGGTLIFSTLNQDSLLHRALRPLGGYENLHFHRLKEILQILKEEELVLKETTFLAFPFPFSWKSVRDGALGCSFLAPCWIVRCVKEL